MKLIAGSCALVLATGLVFADEPPPAEAPAAAEAPPPKKPWTQTDNRAPEPAPSANLGFGVSAPPSNPVVRDKWGLPPAGPTAPIPAFRLVMSMQLAGRINPLGLELFTRLGMQRRLFASEKNIFRDNFFFFGIMPRFSPVYGRVGPGIEIQPLSMFNLRMTVETVGFFPVLGYTTSYASASADFSDSSRDRAEKAKQNYGPTGVHAMIEPTLSARVGPIALRVRSSIEYWRMTLKNGDRVWYEPQLDTLLPANGWLFAQDWDLLYLTRFRFVAGLRYSMVMPLYDKDDVAPGESVNDLKKANSIHRLGPIFAYTFFDKGLTKFNRPSLILIAQWHLKHPSRTGQDVSQGLPLIAVAFAFTSDFLK